MMQDLLSLREEVLTEVFQYSQPSKYRRLPLHVWLRLCSAMNGLIVVRSFNCWNWYHRQLLETAVSRYSDEESRIIHETIGSYMSDIIPEEVRKSKLITPQPLQFTKLSVWFNKSVINELRFIEGFYHLVHGNLLSDAVNELTKFEVICGCVLTGQGFEVIKCIQLLQSKLKEVAISTEVIKRVGHFSRWLYQDMSSLIRDPRKSISVSATSQPKESFVRQNMIDLIQKTKNISGMKPTLDKDNIWGLGRSLGGFDKFTPCLATFHGSFFFFI